MSLTDVDRTRIQYAPVRNVDITVYNPQFNKSKFDDINRNTFLVDKVVKMSARKNPKLDNLKLLVSLHNVYKTERRLSSVYGETSSASAPNTVSESGEFFRRLAEMWTSVDVGNKTFKTNFRNLSKGLSGTLRQFFSGPYSSEDDKQPFEMRVMLEEVVMPLHVHNLKNDETILILSDFGFAPSKTTNFNGSVDKKVLDKIDLKSIENLEQKMKDRFVQTFTIGSGVYGGLKATL